MQRKIELAANVAILAFVAIVGTLYVRREYLSQPRLQSVKVGDRLPLLTNYAWNEHTKTLLLAIRDGCRFCEDSAPFYRELAKLESNGQLGAHVLLAFPDEEAVAQRVRRDESLDLDYRSSVSFTSLKVYGTPTAILTDSQGRVQRVWIGELRAPDQDAVLQSLSSEQPQFR
ncbi:MAG TPA: hypothetical protein VFO34_18130 [Candidatus Acidoferrales bacterium]|nr:hypothetical protein [Candidatus Acidoferrales bacterium]